MDLVFSVILFDKQQLHYYQWHFNERMQTTNEKYPQKEIVNLSLQQEKTLYVQKKIIQVSQGFFWSIIEQEKKNGKQKDMSIVNDKKKHYQCHLRSSWRTFLYASVHYQMYHWCVCVCVRQTKWQNIKIIIIIWKPFPKTNKKKTWFYFISIFLNLEEKTNKQERNICAWLVFLITLTHTHIYIDQLIQSDQQVFFCGFRRNKYSIELSFLWL